MWVPRTTDMEMDEVARGIACGGDDGAIKQIFYLHGTHVECLVRMPVPFAFDEVIDTE